MHPMAVPGTALKLRPSKCNLVHLAGQDLCQQNVPCALCCPQNDMCEQNVPCALFCSEKQIPESPNGDVGKP